MKTIKLTIAFLTLFSLLATANFSRAQKMTAEDVLSKHLDSIGAKDKRAAIVNQVIFSDVKFIVKGSSSRTNGKALFFSSGAKNLWGITLSSNDYPGDKFSYNGKNVKVGYLRPGVRSILGGFVYSYGELLKDGLLGGALSSSWTLLHADSKKIKLSYEGMKKIDDKDTYVLSYTPKSGSDLTVKMYFDAKNFHHLRTEYNRFIAARQGTNVDSSAGQTADRYHLVEDFSDFQNLGGLTLPGTYKLFYSYTSNSTTQTTGSSNRELEWDFKVTNFSYNQKFDENAFDIDAK